MSAQHQPARTFGNKEDDDEENQRRKGFGPQHAPPHFIDEDPPHPRRFETGGLSHAEQQVIDRIGRQKSHRDCQLVKRDQHAPAARRRHLGDVKRRDDRNDADAQPAHDPVDDQLREIGAKGASHGRHREQHGRNEHRPPASQPVAQHARTEYAGDRAGQRTPHIPPLLQAVQPEAGRHQLDGARNHGRVVSEQESAHGSRDRKKEHVRYVSALFHGAFTVSGKGCRF